MANNGDENARKESEMAKEDVVWKAGVLGGGRNVSAIPIVLQLWRVDAIRCHHRRFYYCPIIRQAMPFRRNGAGGADMCLRHLRRDSTGDAPVGGKWRGGEHGRQTARREGYRRCGQENKWHLLRQRLAGERQLLKQEEA